TLGAKTAAIAYDKILFLVSHTSSIQRSVRLRTGLDCKGRLYDSRFMPTQIQLGIGIRGLTADVAHPNMFFALGARPGYGACALGECAAVAIKLPWRRQTAFELKAGKLAMHLAARADALHNLLANVTALGEVKRLRLPGLLGQIAVADVLAVLGNAVGH